MVPTAQNNTGSWGGLSYLITLFLPFPLVSEWCLWPTDSILPKILLTLAPAVEEINLKLRLIGLFLKPDHSHVISRMLYNVLAYIEEGSNITLLLPSSRK